MNHELDCNFLGQGSRGAQQRTGQNASSNHHDGKVRTVMLSGLSF
jgi:hypothetical protein